MKLHELQVVEGARHSRKRVGRGTGSGHGKTACKGHKGQNARSGGGVRPGFEGGQTPLFKRLPKRGFTNVNHKEYATVNVEDLNVFENGAVVTIENLQEKLDIISQYLANKDAKSMHQLKIDEFIK